MHVNLILLIGPLNHSFYALYKEQKKVQTYL